MESEDKAKWHECGNPVCKELVRRTPGKIVASGHVFCSHHCSATVTNKLRQSRKLPRKKCANPKCTNLVEELDGVCCSRKCKGDYGFLMRGYTKTGIVKVIKNFFNQSGRIPLKREMDRFYRPARRLFGTWNQAVAAAGFDPIKTKFSKNWTARDGHMCNSLVERILDDWFSRRYIYHQVHVRYPWGGFMSADFKIGNFWVELFGLKGELEEYDLLRKKKLSLIKEHHLNFIGLESKDVLNSQRLDRKLAPVLCANIQANQLRLTVK